MGLNDKEYMFRFSDNYPISVIPKNEDEKYVIEEAKLWLDENCYKSSLGIDEHINNVVSLGKKITPLIIDIMRENNTEKGMYTHFLLAVISKLYEDDLKFEGYCPALWCINKLIQLYDSGEFDKH